MKHDIERLHVRLVRWSWAHEHADGSVTAGWTATKRGALREIRKAELRDFESTGKHSPLTVGWPQ